MHDVIDATTIRWVIGGLVTAIGFVLLATWRSGRLSRKFEDALEKVEKHEKILNGDTDVFPPTMGLRRDVDQMRDDHTADRNAVKGLLRGHNVASMSDEHRIEADVRMYHAVQIKNDARDAGRDTGRGETRRIAPVELEGVLEDARGSRPPALEGHRQRRTQMIDDQDRNFERDDRRRDPRVSWNARPMRTDDYGTPIVPDAEYEDDPFSETPPAPRRGRANTPFHTGHSMVDPKGARKRRPPGEGGEGGHEGGGGDDASG